MNVHSNAEHGPDGDSRLKVCRLGHDFDEHTALESLQSTLQETKDKVIRLWAGVELQQHLKNVTDTHKANVAKLRAVEERIEELNSLQMALNAIKQQIDNALLHKEKNEELMLKLKTETDKYKQIKVVKETSVGEMKKELDKAADWCRSHFALQLKKISGGKLQLVFTRIDSKDQAKAFYFSVKVNEDKSYSVSECVPPIADLDELVKKLNNTNNFRSFVIVMRQRFTVLT